MLTNEMKPSVWKFAMMIPALFLSTVWAGSDSGLAKKSGAAAANTVTADVVGFWTMDVNFGAQLDIKSQLFLSADGNVEDRASTTTNGTTKSVQSFGTWKLVHDTIYSKPTPGRCKTQGDFAQDCGDTASAVATIVMKNGVKTLMQSEQGVEIQIGTFVGAQKVFTLPDLFGNAAIVQRGRLQSQTQGSRIAVSGSGLEESGGYANVCDLTGRMSGAYLASGFRTTVPNNR